MRVLVIEPVVSETFQTDTVEYLKSLTTPGTEVTVRSLEKGPNTIETYLDVVQASPEIVKIVMEERNRQDAIMINCFADPGLEATREVYNGLALGVAETTMHMAAILSDKFSVITTDRNSIPWTENQATLYGVRDKLAGVVAVDIGVDSLNTSGDTLKRMIEESEKELEKGSEAIVFGCTGMKNFAEALQEKLPVPVLEPTAVTFKIAESMGKIGIKHSKFLRYSMTEEKKQSLNI